MLPGGRIGEGLKVYRAAKATSTSQRVEGVCTSCGSIRQPTLREGQMPNDHLAASAEHPDPERAAGAPMMPGRGLSGAGR